MKILPLSDICADQNPDPAEQRAQLLELLAAGAEIDAADKNGVTALHHAVRFRSPTAVQTLIERGANVNQACKRSGSTPLHRAVTTTGAPGTAGKQAEAMEIIRLLIAAGADPSIVNKAGGSRWIMLRMRRSRRCSSHGNTRCVLTNCDNQSASLGVCKAASVVQIAWSSLFAFSSRSG